MGYAKDKERIRYAGKLVRGANASTLEVPNEDWPWARDGSQVYFAGLKVPKAKGETFAAISAEVGADAKYVFYCLPHLDQPVAAKKPKGFPADVEVIPHVNRLVLKAAGALYLATRWGRIEPLDVDPESFVCLGPHYARDSRHVYWFSRNSQLVPLPDADLATFEEVGPIARDQRGRFLRGQREGEPLEVERVSPEGDQRARAARKLAQEIAERLVPKYFKLFKETLPNDGPRRDSVREATSPDPEQADAAAASPVPKFSIGLDGADMTATSGTRTYRGRASSTADLAMWLYALAEGMELDGTLCLRVLPRAPAAPRNVPDPHPLWHLQLDLAYLMENLGHRAEASLLTDQVLEEQRHLRLSDDVENDPQLRVEKLLPHVRSELPKRVSAQGSTTQAAIKWIVKEGLHLADHPVTRRGVGREMLGIVRSTSNQPVRLAGLCEPLECLLQDSEPSVRVCAAAAFDLLASKLFYYQAYEAALHTTERLAKEGFNLDLQLMRQWECLSALGRDEEAEAAWAGALALDVHGGRAPRQHTGLHTDYPSLTVWRAFGELRLAEAHAFAAEGEHPSDELNRKGKTLSAVERSPDEWKAKAAERVEAAAESMQQLAKAAPAAAYGMSFAEFAEAVSRATGRDSVVNDDFVMYSQYVDYRRYGIPYESTGATIEFAGEFEALDRGQFRPLHEGSEIPCALGRVFGLDFRFEGGPLGRRLPISVRVERPLLDGSVGVEDYPRQAFLGLRETFVFILESPDEVAPGPWTMTVTLFDAKPPAEYPNYDKIKPGEPLTTLTKTFELAATDA